MIFKTLGTIATILFATLSSPALSAQIVDAAGRTVEMDLPAKQVILGEARQVHVVAALKGDKTFDSVVGWRDDLVKKDPDSYAAYVERFPQIKDLPRFGYLPQGEFSLEAAIALLSLIHI